MSYGHAPGILQPRAGMLIGKILNGANPGDLAIELASKFELVIKLKTAKALGNHHPAAPSAARTRVDRMMMKRRPLISDGSPWVVSRVAQTVRSESAARIRTEPAALRRKV